VQRLAKFGFELLGGLSDETLAYDRPLELDGAEPTPTDGHGQREGGKNA
jgi:hypothetical protein